MGKLNGDGVGEVTEEQREVLVRYLTALADDELVMGHRASEWTGLGPILEEDIAFSSIAQDELGHALTFYLLLEELGAGDPDELAFLREPREFRNAVVCELPRGDFAFSLMRQYLYDMVEAVRLEGLAESRYGPLADAAAKLRQEEKYHLMHGRTWVQKLALGSGEARERLQAALDVLGPAAAGLFEEVRDEDVLAAAGIVPASQGVEVRWRELTEPFLGSVGLRLPGTMGYMGGRQGQHTEHLTHLLEAMQTLYRTDPSASW